MDLEARKIRVIKYLLSVEDENELKNLEDMIVTYEAGRGVSESKAFTTDKIIERALEAEKDIDSGNFMTQEELKRESKSW